MAGMTDQEIPSGTAASEVELPELPPITIGSPLAKTGGCELVASVKGTPACVAVLKCDGPDGKPCGQLFKVDLLSEEETACPKCGLRFTWALLVAEVDDDDIIADFLGDVFEGHGLGVQEEGGESEQEQPEESP